MARLVVESGKEAGNVYPLNQPVIGVGRSVGNAIQIVDRRMSRHHIEIHLSGSRVRLKDLGSKNGTLVNGVQAREFEELKHGDRIQIGETIFRVETEAEQAGTSTDVPRDISREDLSRIRLVEEKQWGATRGERRAGYEPAETTAFAATIGLELRNPDKRLEIIYQVIEAIRSVFDIDQLLDRIMTLIQSVLQPDRAYLLMIHPETGELVPEVLKMRHDDQTGEVKISSSIVDRCLKEGVSLLVSDAMIDERFNASASIIANSIRTAMVAPLIFKGDSIGVIYVDTTSRMAVFNDDELDLLTSIANQAAVAITNARLQSQILEQHKLAREMEIARNIQTNLLPKHYPDLPGFQVSAMSMPAKQVGGDYYDFIWLPDGRLSVAVADVSGKGVPAAILTASTRSYLQVETQHKNSDIAQVVARINRMVHRDVTNDMYVTMFFLALDPITGHIDYVNAGHAHPIMISPKGGTEFLTEGGIFLGIDPEVEFQAGTARIIPGTVLVLYTDGVTDILNPEKEPFGSERFYELIQQNNHLSAEEIRNLIYQQCLAHRGPADQFDDFTLIVMKRIDFNESEMD